VDNRTKLNLVHTNSCGLQAWDSIHAKFRDPPSPEGGASSLEKRERKRPIRKAESGEEQEKPQEEKKQRVALWDRTIYS